MIEDRLASLLALLAQAPRQNRIIDSIHFHVKRVLLIFFPRQGKSRLYFRLQAYV